MKKMLKHFNWSRLPRVRGGYRAGWRLQRKQSLMVKNMLIGIQRMGRGKDSKKKGKERPYLERRIEAWFGSLSCL